MADQEQISPALARFAVTEEQLEQWLEPVRARFGFPVELFDGITFVVRGKKYLFATTSDHVPPFAPEPQTIGIPVIRLQHKHLKLTTEGCMLWGPHAVRNVVELDRTQIDSFLQRRTIVLAGNQLDDVSGRGFVIARHRGIAIGIGLYREEGRAEVESLYPRAMAINEGESAFGGTTTRGGS